MADRKQILTELIEKYQSFKEQGRLDLSSEETMRTWINEFLAIFDWDVRDTSQVLQEKVLSKEEKERLAEIGSTSTRPDYTFKRGKEKLTFLDAKGTYINLETDSDAAFQIKSYGWSILAPCAFITNFEEFVIYDCTYIPSQEQPINFGQIHLKIKDYIDNFEILKNHLLKSNILNGKLSQLYSDTLSGEREIQKLSPDFLFAQQLSEFRLALANQILTSNQELINNNSELLAYITQVVINRIIFIRICEARKIEKEGLLKEFQSNGFWNSFKDSSYNDFYEHYDGPLFDRINSIHEIEIPDEVFNNLIEFLYYPSPYRFDVIPTKLLSDIYEIFLSKRLFIENDSVVEKLKLEYIKTNGAVSTPQYLVQDLLKRTIVSQDITKEGINGIFNSKALDFACGSGIFLIELFDHLQNILIECYSSKLILDNSKPDMVSFVKILNKPEEIPARLEQIPALETDSTDFTEIPFAAFSTNPWNFDDADLLRVKTNLLNRHGNFGAYAKVKVGIQVLWDRAYHLTVKEFYEDGTMLCDSHLEQDFIIEQDACRPLLVNERFYSFCSDSTKTYVLFPYDVIEGKKVQVLFDVFVNRYPQAGRYLTEHEITIKQNVETYPDDKWHLFTRENNHQRIEPKVLIPMTANDTFASVTQNPLNYCDNANMFFVDIPEKSEDNLYAIASIINSTLFSVCARSIANPQQNGYFKFNKQFIEPIPFPKVQFENNSALVAEISAIGKNIKQLQNQYLSATPRQKNIHRNSLITQWNSLDEKVYELYQLSDEEKDFFRGRGRNINRIQILD